MSDDLARAVTPTALNFTPILDSLSAHLRAQTSMIKIVSPGIQQAIAGTAQLASSAYLSQHQETMQGLAQAFQRIIPQIPVPKLDLSPILERMSVNFETTNLQGALSGIATLVGRSARPDAETVGNEFDPETFDRSFAAAVAVIENEGIEVENADGTSLTLVQSTDLAAQIRSALTTLGHLTLDACGAIALLRALVGSDLDPSERGYAVAAILFAVLYLPLALAYRGSKRGVESGE